MNTLMPLLTTLVPLNTKLGNPMVNIAIFALFVVGTLTIVIKVSTGGSKKSSDDFYTGGATFDGRQNGLAIAGDYLSAASFLGIVGAVALTGFDGLLYSIGFLVAWLVALLLVAEPLRNTGKYTMADVLSFRTQEKPVRMAAALSTLAVSFFYLLAQMAGAALPMGGTAKVRAVAQDATIAIAVEAVGTRARLRPEVLAGLRGEGLGDGLHGHWVQAYYVHLFMGDAGGRVFADVAEEKVTFAATVPA